MIKFLKVFLFFCTCSASNIFAADVRTKYFDDMLAVGFDFEQTFEQSSNFFRQALLETNKSLAIDFAIKSARSGITHAMILLADKSDIQSEMVEWYLLAAHIHFIDHGKILSTAHRCLESVKDSLEKSPKAKKNRRVIGYLSNAIALYSLATVFSTTSQRMTALLEFLYSHGKLNRHLGFFIAAAVKDVDGVGLVFILFTKNLVESMITT